MKTSRHDVVSSKSLFVRRSNDWLRDASVLAPKRVKTIGRTQPLTKPESTLLLFGEIRLHFVSWLYPKHGAIIYEEGGGIGFAAEG
jgi:hypothetical protein